MLGRTLGSAALAIVICFSIQTPVQAQNLEAGKSPAQIFNGACAVCHKSPRGLVKSIPPSSLPGFLRQHYTTSSDMAGALSSYLLASGGVDRRPGAEKPRRGREARPAAAPEPAPAPAQNSWWPFRREPAAQTSAPDRAGVAAQHSSRKQRIKHRTKKSKAPPSYDDASQQPHHNASGSDGAKPESGSSPASKSERENNTSRTDRSGTVPAAVTPATESEAAEPKAAEPSPAASQPSEPKASESKPPDSKAD
jgi:hypothetical protein